MKAVTCRDRWRREAGLWRGWRVSVCGENWKTETHVSSRKSASIARKVEVVLGAFDPELELSCRCAGQDAIASLGREYTRTSSSRVCRRHANRHRAIFSQVRQDGLYN